MDLFATRDRDLGHTDTVKMNIEIGDHPPIRNRVPLGKWRTIDRSIEEMSEARIIEQSRSPWSFPIVIVKKCFCVNKVIKPCL